LKTALVGFARGCRNPLGFKRTLFSYLLEGGTVKNFICVFALVAMVAFIGCATAGGSGGSSAGSAGGSKSKLTDADFKRMGIEKGSYGNSY